MRCHNSIIQGGAEATKNFWHTTIFYTTRKEWNKIHPFYVQGEQFITLTGNILKVTSIICKSLSWAVKKPVKTLAKHLLYMVNTTRTPVIYGQYYKNRSLQLLYCVCVRLFYTHSFKYPDRNKSGTVRSGDCTGHGITNTQKYSLSLINTGNIHWSIVIKRFLKWYDIISYSVWRPRPPTALRDLKCILKHFSGLCDTLYKIKFRDYVQCLKH
jgi:hypothetical protein